MLDLHVDDRVRLEKDIPNLGLHRGDVGVVCSHWCEPESAFEIEFHAGDTGMRAIVPEGNLAREERTDQDAGTGTLQI